MPAAGVVGSSHYLFARRYVGCSIPRAIAPSLHRTIAPSHDDMIFNRLLLLRYSKSFKPLHDGRTHARVTLPTPPHTFECAWAMLRSRWSSTAIPKPVPKRLNERVRFRHNAVASEFG
jgi:hypothetical protein